MLRQQGFRINDNTNILTSRNDNPEEVHEEVVSPVVVGLRSGVRNAEVVVVEQTGSVIQDVAVDLTKRDHSLQRVTQRVVGGDHTSNDKGERSPADLTTRPSVST